MTQKSRKRLRDNPWIYMAGALVLFLVGHALQIPLQAEHRLLVATAQQEDSIFKQSVIVMVRDQITGSYGVIVNKSGADGRPTGGPVGAEVVSVIHSSDVMLQESIKLGALPVAYSNKQEDAHNIKAMPSPPRWHLVLSGYAGWSSRQLSREIRRGAWRVIEYDDRLVTETPPEKMWAEAMKRPAVTSE
jgi:putative AlgH/UPF0301 family transcriptional regulator